MSRVEENVYKILLEISGARIRGQLLRHLSPRTFSSIVKSLPIVAPSVIEETCINIFVNLSLQADKYTNAVKAGDIVYRPKNKSICIFLKEVRGEERFVPVGRVENVELLQAVRGSPVVRMNAIL